MGEPKALEGIRGKLGIEQPPKPHSFDSVEAALRLQNRSITAQVCVKAAARVAGDIQAGGLAELEDFASTMARRFMRDADDFIYSTPDDFAKRRRSRRGTVKPKKEASK